MKRIPKFKSEKHIRDFWDTHDLTDYVYELKEDRVVVVKPFKENIKIRLKPSHYRKIRHVAKKKGISSTKVIEIILDQSLKNIDIKLKHKSTTF